MINATTAIVAWTQSVQTSARYPPWNVYTMMTRAVIAVARR